MERRHFIQGLVAAVAGKDLVLRATEAEVRAFGIGDQALLHAVNLHPPLDASPLDASRSNPVWCQLSFEDGTKFTFQVGDIEIDPPTQPRIDVQTMMDDGPRYIEGLRRHGAIKLLPLGPIRIK